MSRLLKVALVALLAVGLCSAANDFHVSGAGLPASLTVPTSDEGKVLSTSVNVTTVVIVNTDASPHTVTIQDCQTTPFKLSNGYTITPGTTWTFNLNGIRFQGCFKWTANSTTVQGAVVGIQ